MTPSLFLLAGLAMGAELDKATLPTRVFSLPADPAHLYVDGKQLYLSGFNAGKLAMVPAGGKKPSKQLRLDAYETYRFDDEQREIREIRHAPGGDLVLANGKIFVGQIFQGSILVVDQATFTPIKRLPLGGEGAMAASKDGKTVYFASNNKAEFYIIDTRTYAHRTVAYPPGSRGCMALTVRDHRLYIAIQRGGKMRDGTQLTGGNCFVAVYDLARQDYVGSVFLGQKRPDGSGCDGIPTSLAFSPDGKRFYVGMFQSEAGVQVVDTQEFKRIDNIYFASKQQLGAFSWVDPLSVAVYDRWLLVAIRHNQEIAVVELATHKLLAKITHSEPLHLERVAVQGKQIYVYGGSSAMSMVKGADLSRLLARIDLKKTGPINVTLLKR